MNNEENKTYTKHVVTEITHKKQVNQEKEYRVLTNRKRNVMAMT